MSKSFGLLLLLALPLVACSSGSAPAHQGDESELRSLTKQQALAELDQVAEAIRAYYGPLEYKQQRYGFDLDAAQAKSRAAIEIATTEGGRIRPIYELLAQLKDGHVSLSYKLRADETSDSGLPLVVTPVEGQYLVAGVAPTLGIARGDILVSVDGLTPTQLEEKLFPLSEVGTPESTKHFVGLQMTQRFFYFPDELKPRGPTASVVLQNATGENYTVEIPWRTTNGGLAGLVTPATIVTENNPEQPAQATFSPRAAFVLAHQQQFVPELSILDQGRLAPYFLTAAVRQQYGVVPVQPKAETLTSFGVTIPEDPTQAANYIALSAFKYKFHGKTVMIVRIPGFIVPQNNYEENVAWAAALLKDNLPTESAPVAADAPLEQQPADAIVVDVSHNPGGNATYVQGLVSLFIDHEIPANVQANHADRRWIERFLGSANQLAQFGPDVQGVFLNRMATVERAYDAGKWLADFLPLSGAYQGPTVEGTIESVFGTNTLPPHPLVHWNKPLLVVHDEMSGSGGDVFPTLMKNGGYKTFGARTMGLGGNVEEVLVLPHSGGRLNLTRGLMGPAAADGNVQLIENNGATPTYPKAHTIADFRAGFVGYVGAFSEIVSSM